ncbi:clavaminate synthase-like protein [Phanerochaete sordida]|uniref:Clavaminate synthase-like protein n=1 Tax=Phanerochaete sordida TaxID=48140 RepID=A0A9P3FYD7_9APHY|nr:clavaminate synthase-like protein [Phanerochaete sordida]
MLHALPPRLAARDGLTRRTLATLADAPACAIPLIDFSCFLHARDAAEKRHTADAIVAGFKQALGFIYLKEHGVSEATIRNVFAKSGEFFSLPTETKDSLRWEDPRAKRGYVAIGREQASQSSDPDEIAKRRASAPDYKETMEIGRDWDATWKNQWPAEGDAPRFKDTMLDFYRTCHGLHVQVMRAIALGLGLGEAFFATLVDQQCHTLRLLSYPPVPTALLRKEGQARVAPHSDYGSITLLFQDAVGGLEVQHPHTQASQPAVPIPGTVVVNAADLLARWRNGVLRSTLLRVVAPPAQAPGADGEVTPLRRSVAFFCNPNFDAVVACLPNCGKIAKHAPVTTEAYIVRRLADTYT